MRVLIQRVTKASVEIEGSTYSSIGNGMLILVGIESRDGDSDIEWLTQKISKLRIFDDPEGVMNLDIQQVQGQALVVSQFTLQAATKKGNRPSYIKAAPEAQSKPLYQKFVDSLSAKLGQEVQTGQFGADMQISLVNNGPVTIWIDSLNRE